MLTSQSVRLKSDIISGRRKKMMMPTLYNPFESLTAMEKRIDDLFGDIVDFHPSLRRDPTVDVSETDKKITVKAELPGMDPTDINLSVEDHHMTLKGEKKVEKKKDHEKEHWRECHYGAFSRTFHLPENVDTKKIKAKMKNGLLEITLPKQPKSKPKKIAVHMN
jgi:HSP20 family protein